MARRRKIRRAKSVSLNLGFFGALLFLGVAGAAEEPHLYFFSDLEVVRDIAPMFPFNLGSAGRGKGIEKGRKLEEIEVLTRSKKRRRISEEVWRIGSESIPQATVTAIFDLVENGGLGFEFNTDASGTYWIEVETPRAPDLGPFSVKIGSEKAGVLDPWAPRVEPLVGRRFPDPVKVEAGVNRIDLIQLSPTDSPLYLRAFRLVPAPPETERPEGE